MLDPRRVPGGQLPRGERLHLEDGVQVVFSDRVENLNGAKSAFAVAPLDQAKRRVLMPITQDEVWIQILLWLFRTRCKQVAEC